MHGTESSHEYFRNGTVREIDGIQKIYFDGYWIRYYKPPPETLTTKKTSSETLRVEHFITPNPASIHLEKIWIWLV